MKIASIALAIALGSTSLAAAEPQQPQAAKDADVCLDASHIDHTVVIDDRTILFYMRGNKIWKNTLHSSCPSLKFERAFSEEIRGGQVCSNGQMIRVLETGVSCSLGEFTHYTPPPKSAPN